MQYSGLFVEDTEAEMDVMKTIAGRTPSRLGFCPDIRRAAFWVRKKAPGRCRQEPVVAFRRRFQDIRALGAGRRRHY